MLLTTLNILLLLVSLLVLAPVAVFCAECLLALVLPRRAAQCTPHTPCEVQCIPHTPCEDASLIPRGEDDITRSVMSTLGPRVAVVIPAHNEALAIAGTVETLAATLAPGDRIVVVADNCSDATAEIARRAGAVVLERTDAEHRGKGYALDHAVRYLHDDPPQVMCVIDADCRVRPDTIATLARTAHDRMRPAQATNLLEADPHGTALGAISALTFRFRCLVRIAGVARLGLPCHLMGTGMALPWPLVEKADWATGNVAEDKQLGIDLAVAGHAPLFCETAEVTSPGPRQDAAVLEQRSRWELGHLQTAARQVPRLCWAAMRRCDLGLLAMALDLAVPPLSLLVMVWLAATGIAVAAGLLGARWLPAMLLACGGAAMFATGVGGWWIYCRQQVPYRVLATLPLYILRKVPMYFGFLAGRRPTWIRTRREDEEMTEVLPVSITTEATGHRVDQQHAPTPTLHHDLDGSSAADRSLSILGVRFTDVTRSRAVELIEQMLRHPAPSGRAVYFANAHTLNLATAQFAFRDVLNSADYVFGDGTGVRWAARLQGLEVRANLVGTDVTPELFQTTAGRGYTYFLLGTTPENIERAADYARRTFPGWTQVGYHHGYVRDPAVNDRAIAMINKAAPDALLVGMGNPLQEQWIHNNRRRLDGPVCLAIGGLLDHWAGAIHRPPLWLRNRGCEWVGLLWQQPHKARRYLVGNPMFLARIFRERLAQRA
jgi:exopolysaccharide biosynthesis WecB/TagA/CpsF family protein